MMLAGNKTPALRRLWGCAIGGSLVLFAAPILAIWFAWLPGLTHQFNYFITHDLLSDYALHSFMIAAFTVAFTCIMAVPAAWYMTMYHLPMRAWLDWAMVLPLAMPSYIAAMVYGHLLEGAGPVQYALREYFQRDYGDYPFPEIRSVGGVIFVLSITLYPYVYMLARGAFLMQSQQMLETASMLGCTRLQLFTRLAFPMARPAIVAGAALVMMESLADFGVASLYGIPVLTTGIYRAWLGFYDPVAAGRMATLLCAVILMALWVEKWQRGRAAFHNPTALYHPMQRWQLAAYGQCWLMMGHCSLLVLLGFALPLLCLLYWSIPNIAHIFQPAALSAMGMSMLIAGITACCTLLTGLLGAYHIRSASNRVIHYAISLSTLGYALPGSVIAVGVLLVILAIERWSGAGLFLSATLCGIIWGCALRFTTISFQSLQSGLSRITPMMDEVAMMLGAGRLQRLRRVHMPLLSASAITACLLVFIETVKELPATLLLRPFDVSTLSIRVFELAKDEMLPFAAPVALLLVLVSVVPVMLLHKRFAASRPNGDAHA
ncbi:MAG: iron ABC transporter permease [Sphaerospermopsis sp. SIO1G2]|nr:iron ABC transporter permease [Sphaerospermopsis sp. SIO1G2]